MAPVSAVSKANPLLILAMDHRESFAKQFGVAKSGPTAEQNEQMRHAKLLIYRGLLAARAEIHDGQPGVLVDEQLGTAVLRAARADGVALAMPVERSGQPTFALEFGAETAAHINEFEPDYVKVLVRMNPDDPAEQTATQLDELARLSTLLQELGRPLLYELLVPATDEQLRKAGTQASYDHDIRPELVVRVIEANQQAGIEPALWKIEGLETAAAARHVVAAAKAGGRAADCIVLGRDAPREMLDHWLTVAAPIDGFVGFAVGRSIWEDPLAAHRHDGRDDDLISAVQANYLHFARAYLHAR